MVSKNRGSGSQTKDSGFQLHRTFNTLFQIETTTQRKDFLFILSLSHQSCHFVSPFLLFGELKNTNSWKSCQTRASPSTCHDISKYFKRGLEKGGNDMEKPVKIRSLWQLLCLSYTVKIAGVDHFRQLSKSCRRRSFYAIFLAVPQGKAPLQEMATMPILLPKTNFLSEKLLPTDLKNRKESPFLP